MKHVLLIAVNNTLILNEYDGASQKQDIINQTLLHKLKTSNIFELYLLTDMNLSELEDLGNSHKITLKALVHELKKQRFEVHDVITPADPQLAQGIGAAYRTLYLPAFEKKIKNQKYDEEKELLKRFMPQPQPDLNPDEQSAAHRKMMFDYFMLNKPYDFASISYIDPISQFSMFFG
ncbi:MAG: hypothetical protein J0I93_08845 [Legionella sp.]|nr:hypothetical protein [Legionella sp.]